ncbi:MAG: hypothetical protein PHE88_08500 [Elusimicrobia bacterium]|nr:hypothetical protein [Elusimicrobiota bacterium]
MNLKIRQKQGIFFKQKFNITAKIRLSEIIKLPENKYAQLVEDVEKGFLFKKLSSFYYKNQRIISNRRFSKTDFSSDFLEFNEKANINRTDNVEVESLISKRKETVSIIKKLGIANLKKYFLYNNVEKSTREISSICKISEKDVKKIYNLINELSVHNEFYYPSAIQGNLNINYYKIAKIDDDGSKGFIINYFSPKYSQGKYIINYSNLSKLKKQGTFSKEELKEIDRLLENLNLINNKKMTIFQVIKKITEKQKGYLLSGDKKDIIPYTQMELAKEIKSDNSLVSRAIANRSIETPQNKEVPLQFFFPSKKDIRKDIIKKIIENEKNNHLTDREIKCILKNEFKIDVSRRTVAVCRKESGE